ncbi:THAP domain-containing protein 1-like [Aricia agestis]|uniref:THAP domain-containing protein 1-like n=1 Tax=Aricia agestis TaxID=91739 RepID=UPI001C2090D3|nr:THAP domain-containing protein 1-like [Aricia agestis]XP_041971071.1 THAP domain-containing protein 1-like [Aricia agestis]
MVTCSVIECGTTHRNNPDNYSFHRFPVQLDIRNSWLRLIDRPNWTPKKNSCICSKHFEEKYFRMRGTKRLLIKNAIPTNFVPIKITPRRTVSSYVYRDIEPPELATCIPSSSHSTSSPTLPQQPLPSIYFRQELTPREKKLISKCTKLKDKVKKKQQLIRNLRAQNKRTKNKLITLATVLEEIQKRPGLKDHLNDIISTTCSNTTFQALNEQANAIMQEVRHVASEDEEIDEKPLIQLSTALNNNRHKAQDPSLKETLSISVINKGGPQIVIDPLAMTKSRPQVQFVTIEVPNLAPSINEGSSENIEIKKEVEEMENSEIDEY